MIGELLSTIGLVISGQGMISSIRQSGQLDSLTARMSRSEEALRRLEADAAFIRANLEVLRDLDHTLMDYGRSLVADPRYSAHPERIAAFTEHPELYNASEFVPWSQFSEQFPRSRPALKCYLAEKVLIFAFNSAGELHTATVPRTILETADPFDAQPMTTFEPANIKPLVELLVDIDSAREPGDHFEVQFEEEV